MTRFRRLTPTLVAVLVVATVLAPTATAAVGADTPEQPPATDAASAGVAQVSLQPENNSTVQQRNPDAVDAGSDTSALRGWLSSRLTERLSESALQISEGQYEQADSLLGEEYQDLFGKYVDVAGDTGEQDSEAANAINETAEQTREYAELVAEYRRVYEDYQEAREAGNEARARELARRLNELASRIAGVSFDLAQSFQNVSRTTGADTQDATEAVNQTAQNITSQTVAVITSTFTNTTVTASASSPATFTDPIRVTGTLSTQDGTMPASPATIVVAGRAFSVDLGEDGSFAVSYRRPVRLSTGPRNLDIQFVPGNDSVYLGDRTVVSTDIQAVNPALSASLAASSVAFGDRIPVTGRVTVNGTAVPNAPVRVRVGETTVATVATNGSGAFSAAPRLPAGVEPGDRDVTVVAGREGTAIAEAAVTRAVEVTETPTDLTLSVTQTADQTTLTGRLTTENGAAVPNRPLDVHVGGTLVETVRTDAAGNYEVEFGTDVAVDGEVEVRVSFDGRNTNLGDSRATQLVEPVASEMPLASELPGFLAEERSPPTWLLVAFALSLAGLVYAVYRYYQREPGDEGADEQPESGDERRDDSGPSEPTAAAGEESAAWVADRLAAAREHVTNGAPADAVRAAYPALRAGLGGEPTDARTNWEFYQAVADRLDDETAATLRAATEAYERVTYAGETPAEEDARAVVEEVSELLDGDRAAYPGGSQTTD